MRPPSIPNNGVTVRGWLTSLLFWIAVLAAGGMYALVALSPKILAWQEERARWRENQERLVRLERKVDYLKQVATALESDPEFAAELARVELNATRPGDERLPVEDRLTLAADKQPSYATKPAESPWYEPVLRDFADDANRRRWTLLAAAGLVVFAFTFLQESQSGGLRSDEQSEEGNWFGRRYGGRQSAS